MSGKACIGSRMIGWSGGSVSMRVMHMRRGLPLISAEQEPHLPALQFQRQARSLACVGLDLVDGVEDDHAFADRRCCSPRTCRPLLSPRQMRRVTMLRHGVSRLPGSRLASAVAVRRHVADAALSLGPVYFISSMICFSSAGISGIGACSTCIWPSGPLRTTRLTLPNSRLLSGKSSRKWPPRLSLRTGRRG